MYIAFRAHPRELNFLVTKYLVPFTLIYLLLPLFFLVTTKLLLVSMNFCLFVCLIRLLLSFLSDGYI